MRRQAARRNVEIAAIGLTRNLVTLDYFMGVVDEYADLARLTVMTGSVRCPKCSSADWDWELLGQKRCRHCGVSWRMD